MSDFVMPTLGADMDEGTLVAWRKKPGDQVTKGEIIAEVETDKAVVEVEVFTSGVLERILVQPGQKVPVGTVLAAIREEGKHAVVTPLGQKPAAEPLASLSQSQSPVLSPSPLTAPMAETSRLRISPSAKQLATELGVDPATVQGTGPGGAITRDDIMHAAAQARGSRLAARGEQPPTPLATNPAPLAQAAEAAADRQARMRQTIAAAMARSKREIPHYYLSTTIDMGQAITWLKEENLKRPVADRLLYGALLLKAVALALRQVPELNAIWKGNDAVQSPDIHVGVAISLRQGGLVAPAIHNTDKRTLSELMKSFQDLVKRARAGTLRSSEFSDPTITVTSLGEQGVDTVFGVIYPPQVALVGFGKLVERPWVTQGRIEPRPVITATLSADHRVTDGHRGGLLLAAVDQLLQEPGHL